MDAELAKMLNDQINHEFYSAYLYLGFANYYNWENLDGFQHWFEVQAREEVTHGKKFLKYLQDNNQKVVLETIKAPETNFTNYREPLAATLKHEELVTGLINKLYKKAKEIDDYRCCQFLEWFIAEQGEEEKNSRDLIAMYDLLGGDMRALYLMNIELKGRPEASADGDNGGAA